ncbi:MAG: M20 family metallopeptidase [Pyrinomonadaceae bacterium]
MTPTEILKYYDGRRDEIIASIRDIVEIESPSNDSEQSVAVVDWIERAFRATGVNVEIERVTVDGYGEHIIINAFSGDGPHILLLGHTDTVHPVGTREKNPTRVEGDKYYGCGIFDMKSGIVLMIEALRFLAATGRKPSRPITILLACDEEVGSHSGRPLVEREAANAERCLVFEPSADGRVKTGRKGTGTFKLVAHGAPAHAGLEPEKGANAVAELARAVERVHAIQRPDVGTTVNVTTFHGGTTTNVIPDHAACEIDVRFSSADEAARVESELRSLGAIDARVTLELLGEINRPPMERTDAVVALYKKARDIAATFDYELGETQVGGASDGNFVAALGVPVLDGLGIRGSGAHTLDEHILVSDIAKRVTLATILLQEN